MIPEFLQIKELQWKEISLERNEYLIREGEVEKYIYFVTSGALRAILLKEDEEHTIRFGYTNSLITSINSYFSGKPSLLYIQAIRKSTLMRASKEVLAEYVQRDKESLIAYQQILKDLVASFLEREIDLLTKAPAERLKRLLNRSPQLFQEVPHKYIASYLRMSPETLSRLLKS